MAFFEKMTKRLGQKKLLRQLWTILDKKYLTLFGIVFEIFDNEVFDQIPNTYVIKYIWANTFKYKKYCILFEYLFGI